MLTLRRDAAPTLRHAAPGIRLTLRHDAAPRRCAPIGLAHRRNVAVPRCADAAPRFNQASRTEPRSSRARESFGSLSHRSRRSCSGPPMTGVTARTTRAADTSGNPSRGPIRVLNQHPDARGRRRRPPAGCSMNTLQLWSRRQRAA